MAELRDVVRRLKLDHALREIHRNTGVHRTIIREMRELSEKNGWLLSESALPSEAQIQSARSAGPEDQTLFQQLDRYHDEFKSWVDAGHSYVVMHVLIQDRVKCSETTVRRFVQETFPHKPKAFIRRQTIPAEVMEVDFGHLGNVYDPETRKNRRAYVFSGRLRHSRRAWREIVFDQSQQTFFRCHIHAFEYFNGVCKRVVPDNLKAAVIKASFEDPIVNRAYRSLAEHYGFLIDPCAPHQPQQKGGVESDIKYIKGNFWPVYRERQRKRGHEVPWADELQESLDHWSCHTADVRIVGGVGRTPREIFESEERQKLMDLPACRWDPVTWAQPKVGSDWRIQFEKGFYSVPYCYIGAQLLVYGNSTTVRIYNGLEEIALHNRVAQPWKVSDKEEHAPPHLKEYLSADRNGLLQWAYRLAEPIGQLAEAIVADKAVDGLRPLRALIRLADTFGVERLANACRRALLYDTPHYRSVKEILKHQLDRLALSQPADPDGQLQFRFQRDFGYFDPQTHHN